MDGVLAFVSIKKEKFIDMLDYLKKIGIIVVSAKGRIVSIKKHVNIGC
jgi:hypothetical protein